MFCPKCGKEIADGSAFCSFCGSKMEAQRENAAPAQKIDGSFMQCLETIMEIEERKAVQEKTMAELGEKMRGLGTRREFTAPTKRQAVIQTVPYETKSVNDTLTGTFLILGVLLGAVVGFILWNNQLVNGAGLILSLFSGSLIALTAISILLAIYEGIISFYNVKSRKAAEKKAQALYDQDQLAAHNEYLTAYQQYQDTVAADQERVIAENSQKRVLQNLKEQLEQRHSETESHLTQFYAASGLYRDYTNFVAVSHIYEYLKSGICSKLGGTDGAYMVFKYEMHEKHKEERLDLIGSKIDQLHFDCLTLNGSLGQIARQVSRLADSVDDFRLAYQDAASVKATCSPSSAAVSAPSRKAMPAIPPFPSTIRSASRRS